MSIRPFYQCARFIADEAMSFRPQDVVVEGRLSDRDTWHLMFNIAQALSGAGFINSQEPLDDTTWRHLIAKVWHIYPKDDLAFGEALAAWLCEAKLIIFGNDRRDVAGIIVKAVTPASPRHADRPSATYVAGRQSN